MADTDTDLADSLDSLRYLVATPGGFADAYPGVTDDMLLAILMDGFAEAQLMGLLLTHTVDDDGIVEPALSRGQVALVALFAAIRMMRVNLLNTTTSVTYKAGSAEYSTSGASAAVLSAILADLKAQKQAVIDLLGSGGGTVAAGQAFVMADQYLERVLVDWSASSYSGNSSYPAIQSW